MFVFSVCGFWWLFGFDLGGYDFRSKLMIINSMVEDFILKKALFLFCFCFWVVVV